MAQRSSVPKVVVTGAPGAGKTTLLDALSGQGYATAPDTARGIIQARLRRGLPPRPAPDQFAREILEIDVRQYQDAASGNRTVLFERGIVDALGMLDHLGLLEATELTDYLNTYPYHPKVLVLPPWEAIYRTDAERDQTFAESLVIHDHICRWYVRCGYEPVEVPRSSPAQRCTFVTEAIRQST